MTPRTLTVLRQLGNVSHDDYAQAYLSAITKRCRNLCELKRLQSIPWYDRLFSFWEKKALIRDIYQEEEFLSICRESISWPLVKDQETAKLCVKFERLEAKLYHLPFIRKSLKLDE